MAKLGVAAMLGLAGVAGEQQVVPKPELDLAIKKDGPTTRTAVFAGGCFWCTEAAFKQLDGVVDVTPGYCGGSKETADYETVSGGQTGHAEAIRIRYEPAKITFGDLLQVLFSISEPTVKNKQGPDAGTQYRMSVFYSDEEEKKVVEAYIAQLTKAKVFDAPIVTSVEPIGVGFMDAEEYHKDYVKKHPNQPYVQMWSQPKADMVCKLFPNRVKKK